MTIDDLRAKAESAKAWRPDVCTELECDGHDRGPGIEPEQCSGCAQCGRCHLCLGAQRAVDDVASKIDNAMACIAASTKRREVSRWVIKAARIASYFAAEPNHVSEFRDAVRQFCQDK